MELSIEQVAGALDLPVETVERWVRQGRIPFQRQQGEIHFKQRVLEKWSTLHKLPFHVEDKGQGGGEVSQQDNIHVAMRRGGVYYDLEGTDAATALHQAVQRLTDSDLDLSASDREVLLARLLEREAMARGEDLPGHELRNKIAVEVGVPLRDVEMMEGRLGGSDFSLNATQSSEDEGREWIDTLEDDAAQPSEIVENNHDTDTLRRWLLSAMAKLNEREQYIVRERKLRDEPRTLESIGTELKLSKERVRQVEAAAFGKMRKSLEGHGADLQDLLA